MSIESSIYVIVYNISDPSSITNAVLWGVSALVTKPGHQPWGMEEFMLLGESLGFTDKDLKFIQESAGQDGEGNLCSLIVKLKNYASTNI